MPIKPALKVENLSLWYGENQVLHNINFASPRQQVTALIGPSGCGKSSLLRCLNRMNDLIVGSRIEGQVFLAKENILNTALDPTEIRYRIGMVFQKANPFPKSIFENVAFGLRINGLTDNLELAIENALRKASLWDEVKDRLDDSALSLSGGQQQRLCIARAIVLNPQVLLLDEPCSSLDPVATEHIETLIKELKKEHTVIIVTHNMHQAMRIADYTTFMLEGMIVESGPTETIFKKPAESRTADYVNGRFG